MDYTEFKKLFKQWQGETGAMSSIHGKSRHYIGKEIFKFAEESEFNRNLILSYAFLNVENNHIGLIILHELLFEKPEIPEKSRGVMNAVWKIYKNWGYSKGFIKKQGNIVQSCFNKEANETYERKNKEKN